jgi:hypothetical protein
MTDGPHILIRTFISAASEAEAKESGTRLLNAISALGDFAAPKIKPYWKISECYECSFELRSPNLTAAALSAITKKLGTSWEGVGSACFVWNRSDENYFVDSRVIWAEVEFIGA